MFLAFRRRLSSVRCGACACGLGSACLLLPFAAPSQPSVGDGSALEEVIVTARKLPEDISNVPMSVQALSGEYLGRRDLSSLYELQFEIPGLVVNNRGMFGAGIALRGVTDEGGGNLAIAPHVNGVYLGESNLLLARQFDVERVEIVKGPQGTLYGRNATGGSINVITRAPEEEFGAAVEGAFGSFDTARIQGHVNLPAESFAVRLAVAGSEGDGFIRNSIDDRRFSEEDYVGMRASLRARPTSALTIDATAQRVEDDGAMGELWLPRKDFLPDPSDIRLTTVTLDDPHLSTTNELASVDVAYELDSLTLRSITGYARNVTDALDDCAGTPQLRGCARGVRPLRYEQRSQELRLESIANESLDWLIGGFYFDADETRSMLFSVPGIAPVPINNFSATAEGTAYALFGDATYALGARWSLGGGLRFSRETRRVANLGGDGLADEPAPVAAEDSWDDTSWRLGFEFSPSDRMLVYANLSTGFKSGGITTELLPNGEFDGYAPEELLALEAGMSATLPGRRSTVRASAFFYDFENMQVQTITVLANQVVSVIDNAAAARIDGLDLSATTRVSDRLTVSGALVWMPRREFTEFVNAVNGDILSGNVISRAPEWSVSARIGYRAPLAGRGEFSIDLDYNYRSEFFFTKENVALLAQGAFGLWNLGLRFDASDARWYVFASARNLLDTDYFNQVLIQSAPGYPANYEAGFGLRF
ncbi:MAG TPA: TonB-dependent receptor [Gammaproteobacteria bacterium]